MKNFFGGMHYNNGSRRAHFATEQRASYASLLQGAAVTSIMSCACTTQDPPGCAHR
jgi:hypothetical protein